jgi:hypothetical protein
MIYIFLCVFFTHIHTRLLPENSGVSRPLSISLPSAAILTEKIDISGHWEGTITRDEGGGKRTVYQMEIDVNQKDKEITGISYVHYDDGTKQYHAKMAFLGKINGTYFKYFETKIISSDAIPSTEWCIKKVELIHRIQDTRPTLEGMWEGITTQGECTPGRVFLQRKPPRV